MCIIHSNIAASFMMSKFQIIIPDIRWEETENLLDDGLIAQVSFTCPFLAPVPVKLLNGGHHFLHVKATGSAHSYEGIVWVLQQWTHP